MPTIANKRESISTQIAVFATYLRQLQNSICAEFSAEDDKEFIDHPWEKVGFGIGSSRILEEGNVIEKGGVNFSHISGKTMPSAATVKRPELAGHAFEALGISVVIHPRNPYAPTAHANLRLFVAFEEEQEPLWWFGGGFDLTPYYGFDEDCKLWHTMAKQACDPFGADIYPQFKRACDEYFFLKHRQEPRGIGGLFFDDLNKGGFEQCFALVRNVGNAFQQAYKTILSRRKNTPYTEREREFQLYRRGRYVEFNLVFDRGTLFGLQSNGRTESILMSLPPLVSWKYDYHPEPNSPEEKLYTHFLIPKDWLK